MVDRWPLVGREGLLVELRGRLRTGWRGNVVLAGPAGVGKSRLAVEFATLSERAQRRVLSVRGSRATRSLPLGALAPILAAAPGAADQHAALWSAIAELQQSVSDEDTLLLVDDAHLLDDLSATVVHQIARDGAAAVVATIRTGEPVPDPIAALWTEDLAERIDVEPLHRDDVDDLTARVLEGAVAAATREELWRLSQGNVLFLHELVVGGVNTGALARHDGAWVHVRTLADSHRLEDAIVSRLATLGPSVRNALEVLAVGGRLGYRVFEKLVDATLIGQLEEADFIVAAADGRRLYVEALHPLYTEVLRARMSRARGNAIVDELVAALDATGARRREDTLQMGCWLLDTRSPAHPDLLTRAAAEADRRGDARLAERLARVAIDAGATDEARLILGESLRGQGRNDEAEPILEDLALHSSEDDVRVRAVRWHSKLRFFDPERTEEGLTALANARSAVQPPWDRLLASEHAMMLVHLGRYREAVAVAAPVTAAGPEDPALVLALTALAAARIWIGTPDQADADARRGLALAERVAPEFEFSLLASSLFANMMRGRHPSPSPVLHEERAALTAPATLVLEGRAAAAVPFLDPVIEVLRPVNPEGSLAVFLSYRAEAAALLGDAALASQLSAEAREAMGPYQCYAYTVERSEVWALVADGRIADAIARTLTVAEQHRAEPGYEALALHDAVRLGQSTEVAARLRALADAAPEPGVMTTFALQAAAVANADGAALDAVATTFEEAGTVLWAAEAAAQAAVAHGHAGDGVARLAARRRVDALVDVCGGVRTPALGEGPPDLTEREREVAELAARGLSNAAIAERLYVSVRTVENHLAHVYDKLGVRGRDNLAGALGIGLTP